MIRPGHSAGSLLAAAVVVEKCRGRGEETEGHIESLVTGKVPPRVGPISDDFRCDSCLLNLPADVPEGSGLASTIPLPSARCHWPSVIAADGSGYVLLAQLAERRFWCVQQPCYRGHWFLATSEGQRKKPSSWCHGGGQHPLYASFFLVLDL